MAPISEVSADGNYNYWANTAGTGTTTMAPGASASGLSGSIASDLQNVNSLLHSFYVARDQYAKSTAQNGEGPQNPLFEPYEQAVYALSKVEKAFWNDRLTLDNSKTASDITQFGAASDQVKADQSIVANDQNSLTGFSSPYSITEGYTLDDPGPADTEAYGSSPLPTPQGGAMVAYGSGITPISVHSLAFKLPDSWTPNYTCYQVGSQVVAYDKAAHNISVYEPDGTLDAKLPPPGKNPQGVYVLKDGGLLGWKRDVTGVNGNDLQGFGLMSGGYYASDTIDSPNSSSSLGPLSVNLYNDFSQFSSASLTELGALNDPRNPNTPIISSIPNIENMETSLVQHLNGIHDYDQFADDHLKDFLVFKTSDGYTVFYDNHKGTAGGFTEVFDPNGQWAYDNLDQKANVKPNDVRTLPNGVNIQLANRQLILSSGGNSYCYNLV